MPLLYKANCLACKKSFDTARKYEQHIAEHVERAALPCMACGHELETMAMLEEHAKEKTPKDQIRVDLLPKEETQECESEEGCSHERNKGKEDKDAAKKGARKTIKRKNVKL